MISDRKDMVNIPLEHLYIEGLLLNSELTDAFSNMKTLLTLIMNTANEFTSSDLRSICRNLPEAD